MPDPFTPLFLPLCAYLLLLLTIHAIQLISKIANFTLPEKPAKHQAFAGGF
jgi:hypothetical protein